MGIDVTESVNFIIKNLFSNYGKSLHELISIFSSRNYEIRFPGETARDIIMNKYPKKMELATSASSDQMRRLFTKRKIPISVNEHGATITVLYRTYRIATIHPVFENAADPKCPGTIKAYWMLNAYQRIFTIDSIFIDFNGCIYDYFNACDNITGRHVRLVAIDADALVKSDYLNIFKYFKLYGSVTRSGSGYDCKTIKSIAANMNGLANISGQQIWSEFKAILMQPNRYECVELFLECGGGAFLGLSAYERDLAMFIVKHKAATRHIDDLMHYRQMCLLPHGRNKQICREYVLELLKYHNKKSLFDNLLLMSMPSCIVDAEVLQWQKSQLKPITVENTNGLDDPSVEHYSQLGTIKIEIPKAMMDELSYEHDANADTVKERFSIGKKWKVMRDASPSSKKKQRRQ